MPSENEAAKHLIVTHENAGSRPTQSMPGIQREASVLKRTIALNERFHLSVVLVWAILYAARPFYLGLYSDDWSVFVEAVHGSAPFSTDRLAHFVGVSSVYGARPAAGLVAFIINSIAGDSAFLYQVCAALLVLAAALSLRAWFFTLCSRAATPNTLPADLATIFWMSLPWSLGTTGWVVCAAAQLPAQILFTETARFLVRPDRFDLRRLWTVAFLLVACYCMHEAFYFQFIFVAAFYVLFYRQMFAKKAHAVWLIATVLATQAFSILMNRLVAHLNPGFSKTFSANWWTTVRTALQVTPGELKAALGVAGPFWVKLILVFIVVSLISIVLGLVRSAERRAAVQRCGLIALAVIAMLVSTVVYALAFYRVTPVGFMGRTLNVVSWAFSTVFLALISSAVLSQPKVLRRIVMTTGILVILVNSMALRTHAHELAFVWSQEEEVLNHVPTDQFKTLPPDSRVLYIGPAYFHDWAIFGAEWELTPAVFSRPPLSEGRTASEGWTSISPATMGYNWTWDGHALIQDCPGSFVRALPAKHVFVWNYGDARLHEVQQGYRRIITATAAVVSGPPPGGGSALGSVTHTNPDANAWWQVDLGSSAKVKSIKIWNRTDGSLNRLSDYWVFVSDAPFGPAETPATLQSRSGTWSSHQTSFPNPLTTIAVGGAQGRHVRVQLAGNNYLSLAEVQVFGALAKAPSRDFNLSLRKAAAQSSTLAGYAGAGAEAAVDGNTDGRFTPSSSSTAPVARFVGVDTKAMGAWKGVYGADGSIIAADSANYPGYVQVEFAGQALSTWAPSTRSVRALEASEGMHRIASAWSSASDFTIDISLMDAKAHRVSLYCLDWDEAGRTETIDVLNASNENVLESHTISDFADGRYLTFDLSGHVKIRITRTAGTNAVLSGLFFQ